MDIQDKTKEELIIELRELKQAYNSLKFSIETDLLEHEMAEAVLVKSLNLIKNMEKAAKIGGWEFDVATMVQTWTEETFNILEIDSTNGAPDVPEGIGFIAPEYQPMALLGIQRAIEFGEPYNQEWEVITAKGNKRWINAIATPYQENGKTKSVSGSFQDITKRKLAEIALVLSEENLSITLYSIGDGVISTDKNGLVIQMNPVAETLCGWKLTEALGKPLAEVFTIINAETHQTGADPVQKVLEKGEIVGLANHTILVSKNGVEYQIADSAAPIKNKEGEITGVVWVFSDITGTYTAQKQIKENEERYRSLLNNLEAGIVVHAADTSIVMNNPRASELLGLSHDQMTGKVAIDPVWKFIHPDNTHLTLDEYPVNKVVSSRKPIKNQVLGIHQPGKNEVVWVTVNGFPVLDNKGEITEVVISFIDITDRIQADEKIKLNEEKFSKSFFNSPDSIIINRLDDGKIVTVNNGFRKIMGYEEAEVIGKTTTELNFYKNNEERNAIINALKTKGQALDIECWFITKNGEEKLGLLSAAIIDIDGVKHIMSTSRDVTGRKQSELLLQEKTEVIKAQNEEYQQINEELIQTNQDLAEARKNAEINEARMKLAMEISKSGAWDWDILKNTFYWSDEFLLLFGLPANTIAGFEAWTKALHPDDIERASIKIQEAIENRTELLNDYRIILPNNEIRWIRATGHTTYLNNKPERMIGLCMDITWQKMAEQELYNSKERAEEREAIIKASMENSQAGIVIAEYPTGKLKYANKAALLIRGKEYDEIVKDIDVDKYVSSWQILHFDGTPYQTDDVPLTRAIRYGEKSSREFIVRRDNNEDRYVLANAAPIYNTEGIQTSAIVIFLDITDRKQAEKALKESEERFKNMFERHSSIMLLVEPESGMITDANEASVRFYGYSKAELLAMRIDEINILMPEQVKKERDHAFREEMNYFIFPHRMANGEVRTVEVHSSPIVFQDHQILFSIIHDITERKKIEQELLTSKEKAEEFENKFRQIAENIDEVFWLRTNSEMIYVSPSFEKIWGIPSKEIYKNPQIFTEKIHPDDKPVVEEIVQSNEFKDKDLFNYEYRILRADNQVRWINAKTFPILDDSGQIIKRVGIASDITEKHQTVQELIQAKEHAEESDRLKSAFLANMSHEIRTPMNGILGFAGLLNEPDLSGEQQQEYIKIIEKSGARMLNIINDIVDISKIEAGLMNLNINDTDINEKIEFIYLFFKPQVEEKGMQLFFKNTLPTKEAIIRTDNEKVYSILTNLVKNAIKYSNKGAIEFGYLKKGELLEFYVKDTGIGIPKDRQSAIFERFIQADISDKMARQGAGLGLSISKAYVEMLGGKIWVESEEGIGSTFYFTLPYHAEPEEKIVVGKVVPAEVEKNQIKKLKVLIAEDDETSEMLISITVKEFSKLVIKANTGNEAVEICKKNLDIDLILMDIQMPVMNGYEATRQIRQFNKYVVIIAQTAFGLSGDREKAIEAGCNDYISKPINKDELISLIQKYFKK